METFKKKRGMGGGGAEDWVNSCSPGLTKTICRVSAGITVHCNVQRVGGGMGRGGVYSPCRASVHSDVSWSPALFSPWPHSTLGLIVFFFVFLLWLFASICLDGFIEWGTSKWVCVAERRSGTLTFWKCTHWSEESARSKKRGKKILVIFLSNWWQQGIQAVTVSSGCTNLTSFLFLFEYLSFICYICAYLWKDDMLLLLLFNSCE